MSILCVSVVLVQLVYSFFCSSIAKAPNVGGGSHHGSAANLTQIRPRQFLTPTTTSLSTLPHKHTRQRGDNTTPWWWWTKWGNHTIPTPSCLLFISFLFRFYPTSRVELSTNRSPFNLISQMMSTTNVQEMLKKNSFFFFFTTTYYYGIRNGHLLRSWNVWGGEDYHCIYIGGGFDNLIVSLFIWRRSGYTHKLRRR
jgi:hypothetical protein